MASVLNNFENLSLNSTLEDSPYSIADIVRSHQSLNSGFEIRNRMGNRSFLFYLRHQRGAQMVEILVRHDADFEFSSLRLPRLVGSYL